MDQKANKSNQLERGLSNRHVQMIALGGAIGTGLFLASGESIHDAGPAILISYLITGIICFWMMRAMGEMMMTDVSYGSFVDLIHKYWSHQAGFVIGWAYWASWIAIAMAELTAIGIYIKLWLPGLPQWVPGLITLLILICVNLITVKAFGEVEFWFALVKILAIIVLILIGVFMMIFHFKTNAGYASPANLVSHGGFFPRGIQGIIISLPNVVFAFLGVEMVGMTAAETKDPHEVIPRAINNIPVRILIFYIGALGVIMCIYPWFLLHASSSPFVMVFKETGIASAADIINFVVITAAASSCNSALFTTGRMLSELTAKSKSKRVRWFSKISSHAVPSHAIMVSAALILISVLLNYFIPSAVFSLISGIATTSFLFIWGSIVIAHLKFRKQYHGKLEFKMPLYPISDYIVLVFFAIVGVTMLIKHTTMISLFADLAWFAILVILSFWHKEVPAKEGK